MVFGGWHHAPCCRNAVGRVMTTLISETIAPILPELLRFANLSEHVYTEIMTTKDPLSGINPRTVGYGKSGYGAFKKDDKYSYTKGVEDVMKRASLRQNRTLETANLTPENLETIMGIIGQIVGNKASKYSGLDRYDEEKFRHLLEIERRHGRLSDADLKDAWKIWKNFDA